MLLSDEKVTTGSEDWSFQPGDIFIGPVVDSPDWQRLYNNVANYTTRKYLQLNHKIRNCQEPILTEAEIDGLCAFFNTKILAHNGKIVFLDFSHKNPETMGLFINSEGAIREIELLFFEEDVVGYLQKVDDDE